VRREIAVPAGPWEDVERLLGKATPAIRPQLPEINEDVMRVTVTKELAAYWTSALRVRMMDPCWGPKQPESRGGRWRTHGTR